MCTIYITNIFSAGIVSLCRAGQFGCHQRGAVNCIASIWSSFWCIKIFYLPDVEPGGHLLTFIFTFHGKLTVAHDGLQQIQKSVQSTLIFSLTSTAWNVRQSTVYIFVFLRFESVYIIFIHSIKKVSSSIILLVFFNRTPGYLWPLIAHDCEMLNTPSTANVNAYLSR